MKNLLCGFLVVFSVNAFANSDVYETTSSEELDATVEMLENSEGTTLETERAYICTWAHMENGERTEYTSSCIAGPYTACYEAQGLCQRANRRTASHCSFLKSRRCDIW